MVRLPGLGRRTARQVQWFGNGLCCLTAGLGRGIGHRAQHLSTGHEAPSNKSRRGSAKTGLRSVVRKMEPGTCCSPAGRTDSAQSFGEAGLGCWPALHLDVGQQVALQHRHAFMLAGLLAHLQRLWSQLAGFGNRLFGLHLRHEHTGPSA